MFVRIRRVALHIAPALAILVAGEAVARELPREARGELAERRAESRIPSPPIEVGEVSGAPGKIEVTKLQADDEHGVRYDIRLEDDVISDTITIDEAANSVSAFGLTFAVEHRNGIPVATTVSGNGDSVAIPANATWNDLSGPQKAAMARLSKFFSSTNGPERAARAQMLVQALKANHHRGPSTLDLGFSVWGCMWEIIDLAMAWVGVVAACGTPVVNLFLCLGAIALATTATIMCLDDIQRECT